MHIERYLRLISGIIVLLSLLFSRLHSENWLFLTAFMGFNLIQSSFTDWCPMMPLLKMLGVKSCGETNKEKAN